MSDDWRPTASLENLRLRAELLACTRQFFAERGVLEVETPLLSAATVSDPHLHSFVTHYSGPGLPAGQPLYLQTSPEAAMKRLLAAGTGSIYQICKAFRDGEYGACHNPEFTMLEWYRAGFDHFALMAEVEALVQFLMQDQRPFERCRYSDIFKKYLDLDPHCAPLEALVERASDAEIAAGIAHDGIDRDGWLDLLMSHLIEPNLGIDIPCFVYDYPASQAVLARTRWCAEGNVAERFELYVSGLELANGYHELCDGRQAAERFQKDSEARATRGIISPERNSRLLAAMEAGLPASAGVALGFDRLLMVIAGVKSIDEAITFPVTRA